MRFVDRRKHATVIRGNLLQYPASLLADRLDELEDLGYLASKDAASTQGWDFAELLQTQKEPKTTPGLEDQQRIETRPIKRLLS